MKHTTLSAVVLVAFGLMPSFGMLGGGNVYFDKGDPAAQQSADAADQSGTKGTVRGTTGQKTAEIHRAALCKNAGQTTCYGHDAQPAQ